jgi:hypothetical protein
MSRAREATQAWVVADDLAQATEDLRRDWSVRRTPTWALDAGLPATPIREAVVSLANPDHARVVALARTRTTAQAAAGLQSVDFTSELAEARAALQEAKQARADLLSGRGAYLGTEAGQAVSDVARAEVGLAGARREAEHGSRRWARRTAAKEVAGWTGRDADARQRWQDHVAPEAARLDAVIGIRQDELERSMPAWSDKRPGRQRLQAGAAPWKGSSPVLAPVSNSAGTAWTAPDGHLLGVLSYWCTRPSGLPPFTLRKPPALIMARTCNQFRATQGRRPARRPPCSLVRTP